MEPATRILRQYDRGTIVRSELITRLVHLAAAHPPEEVVAALPPDCLAELRAEAARPPSTLEECPITAGFDYAPRDEDRRLWYSGIWRWHHYFANA
jgi:hypothetical protein